MYQKSAKTDQKGDSGENINKPLQRLRNLSNCAETAIIAKNTTSICTAVKMPLSVNGNGQGHFYNILWKGPCNSVAYRLKLERKHKIAAGHSKRQLAMSRY